jgi:pimeloyl-ACP methyl ester carboxylesterase
VDPIIQQPALMIYGEQDMIPKSENLADFVPNVDEVSLDCGHWIQQEKPEEATRTILEWLARSHST